MATVNETYNIGDLVHYEFHGSPNFCRNAITVISGQNLALGTVVGTISASGKVTALAPAASDGSQNASGVILEAIDASGGDKAHYMLARGPAVLRLSRITWAGSPNAAQKAAALAQLNAVGIVVRTEV